ncbi:hypothetical protein [Enterococcus sp. LJL51]|uniref:hypothetical protein n=1 Tax=Enterococcus sp. LJL51 TaxID=3416656 RepID=UPI003CF9FE08
MIVTCLENYRESLIKGKDYLVIEIYTNIRTQEIAYRTSNEQGVLAIYDHKLFEIKKALLNGYAIKINNLHTQIMLDDLLELEIKSINSEGIWDDYLERNKKTIEIVHQIIKKRAKNENIEIIEPIAY